VAWAYYVVKAGPAYVERLLSLAAWNKPGEEGRCQYVLLPGQCRLCDAIAALLDMSKRMHLST